MLEGAVTPAEIARSALADMDEPARAELMLELLCALRGPRTVELLCFVRRELTARVHELLAAEAGILDGAAHHRAAVIHRGGLLPCTEVQL